MPPSAPFAPSGLSPLLSLDHLLPFGTQQPAKAGETLVHAGAVSTLLIVPPPRGVTVELRLPHALHAPESPNDPPLATLRHGGVFGAEGALLGVPSLFSARVKACERGASLLVLSGAGLNRLRATQPVLHTKLLAEAMSQQQEMCALIARRSVLLGGGNGSRATATEPFAAIG
jgi:hypothetical protein